MKWKRSKKANQESQRLKNGTGSSSDNGSENGKIDSNSKDGRHSGPEQGTDRGGELNGAVAFPSRRLHDEGSVNKQENNLCPSPSSSSSTGFKSIDSVQSLGSPSHPWSFNRRISSEAECSEFNGSLRSGPRTLATALRNLKDPNFV